MNPNERLTTHLKALLAGGAAAVALSQHVQAAALPAPDAAQNIETRVAKVRESLSKMDDGVVEGRGPIAGNPDMMWWRNAWGNGGWHNWGNGWHNWHNGGWGNWHNW
jgi:rSAM-associated Gly-rich repeat protein